MLVEILHFRIQVLHFQREGFVHAVVHGLNAGEDVRGSGGIVLNNAAPVHADVLGDDDEIRVDLFVQRKQVDVFENTRNCEGKTHLTVLSHVLRFGDDHFSHQVVDRDLLLGGDFPG